MIYDLFVGASRSRDPSPERRGVRWGWSLFLLAFALVGSAEQGPVSVNLALGKNATASHFVQDAEPQRAIDGDPETYWSAGRLAPQWIVVDLGTAVDLQQVRLLVRQPPSTRATRHHLEVKSHSWETYTPIHTFDDVTKDRQWLELALPETRPGVRYVRVRTEHGVSHCSWSEIEIFAG